MEKLKSKILQELAEKDESNIVFEKLDGSTRTMRCTRKFDSIPEEFKPKSTEIKKGLSIPVFDLEKEQWRAFRLDKLKQINEEDIDFESEVKKEEDENNKDR